MLRSKKGYSPIMPPRARFSGYNVPRVVRVSVDRFKINTPDRILYVQVILEFVRDRFRVTNDQEIKWHSIGIGRTRAYTMP